MEKWEHQLTQQVNMALPEQVDQRINLTLKQLKRNRNQTTKLRYGAVAVAAAITFTFGLTSLSPTFADAMKSIPVIGSVFEVVGDIGAKRGSQLHLATRLGQQVQIEDYAVTFTESLYDGSNIHLGLTAPSDHGDPMTFVSDVLFTVDGQRLSSYGVGASGKMLDDGTYAGTLSISADDRLPDAFVLGILSRDESTTYAQIPVERRGANHTFSIAQTRAWNNIEVKYEAIALFPTSTEISFQLSSKNVPDLFWDFKVHDDQGRVLQPISVHGGGASKDNKQYKVYLEPFETVPARLTIKPYTSSSYATTKTSAEWNGISKTLSQGEAGAITVVDQRIDNNRLTLIYEVEGAGIFEQANQIWLEDHSGIPLYKDGLPIRVQGSNHQYQVTFSNVSSVESLSICTPRFYAPNYLEDLAVTVDLQKKL